MAFKRTVPLRDFSISRHQIWCAHAIVVQRMHACVCKMPSCSQGPAFNDAKINYLQGRVSFDEDGNRQSLVQFTQNKRKWRLKQLGSLVKRVVKAPLINNMLKGAISLQEQGLEKSVRARPSMREFLSSIPRRDLNPCFDFYPVRLASSGFLKIVLAPTSFPGSLSYPSRDPGWVWSRVSQNLGDYKQTTWGRSG